MVTTSRCSVVMCQHMKKNISKVPLLYDGTGRPLAENSQQLFFFFIFLAITWFCLVSQLSWHPNQEDLSQVKCCLYVYLFSSSLTEAYCWNIGLLMFYISVCSSHWLLCHSLSPLLLSIFFAKLHHTPLSLPL